MGNKVNLLSSQLKNFFKFRACAISARKAKHLDVTTMLTNSQANTPLGQLERAYYFSYLINSFGRFSVACVADALRGFTVFHLSLATKEIVEVCTQATVSPILSCVLWVFKEWVKY